MIAEAVSAGSCRTTLAQQLSRLPDIKHLF
jgi:hypothetical protein